MHLTLRNTNALGKLYSGCQSFYERFPVLVVASVARRSVGGRQKITPPHARKKPLVPMVRKLLLEIKLALAIASYKFKMSSSYSFLGGLQLYFFLFFSKTIDD